MNSDKFLNVAKEVEGGKPSDSVIGDDPSALEELSWKTVGLSKADKLLVNPSAGFSPEDNLKAPVRFFSEMEKDELYPRISMNSDKLYGLVQKLLEADDKPADEGQEETHTNNQGCPTVQSDWEISMSDQETPPPPSRSQISGRSGITETLTTTPVNSPADNAVFKIPQLTPSMKRQRRRRRRSPKLLELGKDFDLGGNGDIILTKTRRHTSPVINVREEILSGAAGTTSHYNDDADATTAESEDVRDNRQMIVEDDNGGGAGGRGGGGYGRHPYYGGGGGGWQKPIKCPFCSDRFATNLQMAAHKRSYHRLVYDCDCEICKEIPRERRPRFIHVRHFTQLDAKWHVQECHPEIPAGKRVEVLIEVATRKDYSPNQRSRASYPSPRFSGGRDSRGIKSVPEQRRSYSSSYSSGSLDRDSRERRQEREDDEKERKPYKSTKRTSVCSSSSSNVGPLPFNEGSGSSAAASTRPQELVQMPQNGIKDKDAIAVELQMKLRRAYNEARDVKPDNLLFGMFQLDPPYQPTGTSQDLPGGMDGVRMEYVHPPPNCLLSSPSTTQLSSVLCRLATSGPPQALPASSSSTNKRNCATQKKKLKPMTASESMAAQLVTAPPFTWKKLGRLGLSSSSAQPTPRHGHRAVIHKESMIVYGGGNDGIFSGLHVLNLASLQWSKPTLQGNGPEGLAAFGMILNHGKITIFGGAKERCYTNELWQLDLSTWTWMQLEQKAAPGGEIPCPRIGHSFTLAPPNKNEVANEIYVFGGLSGNRMERGEPSRYLDDLYILNEVDKRGIWRVPITFGTPPSHRESHSAVTHVHVSSNGNVSRLIVFGGAINGVRLRDCYVLDLDTKHWLQVVLSGISPTPRSLHSANVIGKKTFIFGRWVPEEETDKKSSEVRNKRRCSNSLECLDLETFQWESIQDYVKQEKSGHSPRPLPRAGHSAVAYNGSLFLLYGYETDMSESALMTFGNWRLNQVLCL